MLLTMKTTLQLLILLSLSVTSTSQAAKCKFEVEEPGHVESRMVLLFRGGLVGLHMTFDAKGERHSEIRDVKSKHAEKILASLECVSQSADVATRADDAP